LAQMSWNDIYKHYGEVELYGHGPWNGEGCIQSWSVYICYNY